MLTTVGRPAATKVVVMGLSGLVGVFTSRLIIGHFGTDAYAQYGLLATFPSLLPFADLGIASVIFNVVAASTDVRSDLVVRRTITTAFRILLASGGILGVVAVAITLLGWWPAILGGALLPGAELVPMLCLVVFGMVLPLTVGQRILVGLGRTTTQVAAQAVVAPFMFLGVDLLAIMGVPAGNHIAVVSYVANAMVSVICLIIVAPLIRPTLGAAVRDIPRVRSAPGVKVLHLAWPMLLQMLVLPIAMQTDRILLSHLAGSDAVAQYNLASQLFNMVMQAIAAGGIALWPVFARARSDGELRSPIGPTWTFLGAGLALSTALALIAPFLARFISDGEITFDPILLASFVAFAAVTAAKYPAGMYMTDEKGLRFQILPILVLVPLNLAISWWLIGVVGAAGPIIGSVVATLLCQVLPNLWWVRRDLGRRAAAAAAEETA